MEQYNKNTASLKYSQTSALPNADLLLKQANKGYLEGDTDYSQYLMAIRNALILKENYLKNLNQLNHTVIQLELLSGNE